MLYGSVGSTAVRVAGDEWELTADVEMHEGQARTYMSLLEEARKKAVKAAEEATEAANSVNDAKAACEEQTVKTEKTNSDIMAAETARVTAESGRVTAESERVNAENARVAAENNRAQSEQSRETAETERANAEKTRAAAETARAAAETQRKDAETQRETDFSSAKEACEAATSNATAAADKANTAADKANDATAAATKAEKGRQDAEDARVTAENARVAEESERVKNENARAKAEAARVTAEEKRAEDIGQAVSKANAASEVAVTANEPFVWEPFKDLEHWNITAIDFATGTVTLDTEKHGLAEGDLVTLAANICGYSGTYALGRSLEYYMSSSSMKNFPVKRRDAIPSMKVTAVNGAEIQLDRLKVSTSIVPVPSEWQLQRCATSGRTVALPTRFKGKPVTVTVEGQYVSYNSSWSFFNARRVLIDDMGRPIFSPIGDEKCGLPFVKQICSMRSGHLELIDIGVSLYGEEVTLGNSPSTLFYSIDKEDGWDISRATNLFIENILGHYATRVTVTPYRELTKMG